MITIRITGDGIDTSLQIGELEDLEIIEKHIAKIRRGLSANLSDIAMLREALEPFVTEDFDQGDQAYAAEVLQRTAVAS